MKLVFLTTIAMLVLSTNSCSDKSTTVAVAAAASSCARVRKSWNDMTAQERDVYIEGFQLLTKNGVIQRFSRTHVLSGQHLDDEFLPWHRHFLFLLEEEIRALGDRTSSGGHDYSCFALPYWNWADENHFADPIILDSGLGSDGDGFPDFCVKDGPFAVGSYTTLEEKCLKRDYDYSCRFSSAPTLLSIIEEPSYSTFLQLIWKKPHATPHACIAGNMLTFEAPDDPIFYLHHAFVDFLWALWQNVHAEELDDTYGYTGDAEMCLDFDELAPPFPVSATLNLLDIYGASYEQGSFWDIAHMSELGYDELIDDEWFVSLSRLQSPFMPNAVIMKRGSVDPNGKSQSAQSFEAIAQGPNGARRRRRDDIYHSAMAKTRDTGQGRSEVLATWAYDICVDEEDENGELCEPPPEGFDDCSEASIDPQTGDIDVSLSDMLAKHGNTECMNSTIQRFYEWAANNGELRALCRGCYDPFCAQDRVEGRCGEHEKLRRHGAKHTKADGMSLVSVVGAEHETREVAEMLWQWIVPILICSLTASVFCFVALCRKRLKSEYLRIPDSVSEHAHRRDTPLRVSAEA